MTYKETIQKIGSLEHLIGNNAPKWNSPILAMIPAPTNASFHKYIIRISIRKRATLFEQHIIIEHSIQLINFRRFNTINYEFGNTSLI